MTTDKGDWDKAVPPFLAVLLACYVVGSFLIAATKTLHELRDLAIGVKKIEEGDRIDKLRIRISALLNSYLPIWRGICCSLLISSAVLMLSAIFLDGDLPNRKVSIFLLWVGAGLSFASAFMFYHAGGQEVRAIEASIESEMQSALLGSQPTSNSAGLDSSGLATGKVLLDQLARLPRCVRDSDTRGAIARWLHRYGDEVVYSTVVFFCGIDFNVDRLQQAETAADVTPTRTSPCR